MKYTHLIWDFNGTVLNDVDVSVDAANALLKRCGVSAIPGKEFYRSVFGFPIKDYYERLGIDFEKTSFEDLAPVWVEEYLSRAPRAGMNEGVLQTIAKVRAMGVSQILLSATEADMRLVCTPANEYDAFAFTHAIMDGRHEVALAILADYRMRRIDPIAVLSEVTTVICNLMLVRAMTAEGATVAEIAAVSKLRNQDFHLRPH